MDEPRDQLGADIRRLVAAAQDWARTAFPEPAAPRDPAATGHTGTSAAGGECVAWCPICQLAQVLRGEHPEVIERLTEAGAALASAVKALADAALTRTQSSGGSDQPDRPRPAPRVQRIHLDDPDGA